MWDDEDDEENVDQQIGDWSDGVGEPVQEPRYE